MQYWLTLAKKYPVPGLHVGFAEKEQTVQQNGPLTEGGLRGMMTERIYYAIDAVFPFAAGFIERSLGFMKRCNLTRMTVLYTGMGDKTLSRSQRRNVGG